MQRTIVMLQSGIVREQRRIVVAQSGFVTVQRRMVTLQSWIVSLQSRIVSLQHRIIVVQSVIVGVQHRFLVLQRELNTAQPGLTTVHAFRRFVYFASSWLNSSWLMDAIRQAASAIEFVCRQSR